jgi:arsenate reductase (thioredoxin)
MVSTGVDCVVVTVPGRGDLEARIDLEVARLLDEYEGTFGRGTVERYADEAREVFADSKLERHLPTLVYRYVRQMLGERSRDGRTDPRDRPSVLFVCVHNAGRSQMAAALTKHLGGSRVVVQTAGSTPAAKIHPQVVDVLRELGLDPHEEFPKPLANAFVMEADVIITMGCGDTCPVFPGKRYEDWNVDDPAGQSVEEVRRVRDDIGNRVRALLGSLGVHVDEEAGN